MKRILFCSVAIISLILGVAKASHAATDQPIYASGSGDFEFHHYFGANPFTGKAFGGTTELNDAVFKANKEALKNAKAAFAENCRNVKNGEPSGITAIVVAEPGQSQACVTNWEDTDKGSVVCSARARGTCKTKERDPRISDKTNAPANHEVVIGDHRYVDLGPVAPASVPK